MHKQLSDKKYHFEKKSQSSEQINRIFKSQAVRFVSGEWTSNAGMKEGGGAVLSSLCFYVFLCLSTLYFFTKKHRNK